MLTIYLVNRKTHGSFGDYVGRPSILANPFPKQRESERQKVIDEFEEYIEHQIDRENHLVLDELDRLKTKLIENKELRLVCWCSPRKCHSEIIARIIARSCIEDGYEVNIVYLH